VLPPIKGEPAFNYAPGSPERASLVDALKRVRSEVVEIPVVVGGERRYTGETVDQVMPSDHGHVIARVHLARPSDVSDAVAAAAKVRADWAELQPHHRAMVFRKAADILAGRERARVMATTMLGIGKTVWQAEIDASVEQIDFLRSAGNFAERVYAEQPDLHAKLSWNRMKYRGLEGYVAAISPFNFTAIGANLVASPAVMGNTVLWKPAPSAALGNWLTLETLEEAGMPAGVVNFLPSSPEVFQGALTHPTLAGLHFTGSTRTFSTIWRLIGDNLRGYHSYPRIVGETGGKNFHLIHPSADVTNAALQTVRAAFEYQGQKCSACSRLYVPRSLYRAPGGIREQILATAASLKMGQPDDLSTFMSAVIDKAAADRLRAAIEGARVGGPGTRVVLGGTVDTSRGYFVEPTVIETDDPLSPTMVNELFGPVLTVFEYDDTAAGWRWEDTLALVDRTSPYGLTGAVFARDRGALSTAETLLVNSVGNLYFNDKSTGAVVGEQPFGGARASGTNDKAGSYLNLLRWVSPQTIKETTVGITSVDYPHMQAE
jgi:1-pyrroline-5-carboxylate dehydrogenase